VRAVGTLARLLDRGQQRLAVLDQLAYNYDVPKLTVTMPCLPRRQTMATLSWQRWRVAQGTAPVNGYFSGLSCLS
jgi:hypothetical protein